MKRGLSTFQPSFRSEFRGPSESGSAEPRTGPPERQGPPRPEEEEGSPEFVESWTHPPPSPTPPPGPSSSSSSEEGTPPAGTLPDGPPRGPSTRSPFLSARPKPPPYLSSHLSRRTRTQCYDTDVHLLKRHLGGDLLDRDLLRVKQNRGSTTRDLRRPGSGLQLLLLPLLQKDSRILLDSGEDPGFGG